jgi:DNA-directed RNA polymerase subunit beta'
VPYGAVLTVADQEGKGHDLGNWDPLTRPVSLPFAGKAQFENVEEGLTVAKPGLM